MQNFIKIFVVFLLFISQAASGQQGNLFLKHYTHTTEEADNLNFWIREEKSGVMVFANAKGLLFYDGIQWKLHKTEQTPLSIETDAVTGKIFTGMRDEFGYYVKDLKGALSYHSLSKNQNPPGDITRIVKTESRIYFCNEKRVYELDPEQDRIEHIYEDTQLRFTGFASAGREVLINVEGQGLCYLSGTNLLPVQKGELLAHSELLFSLALNENKVLLGTNLDELFIYEGGSLKRFATPAETYLKQNLLSDATLLNEKEIVLGTLAGGCIVVDGSTGAILQHINSETGLPDNEVFALGRDKNGGIWITHNYGFTRIDPNLSFKDFTSYPGLEGHLLSVLYNKSTLYVSTSEGVFYLTREREEAPSSQSVATRPADKPAPARKNIHLFFDHLLFKRKITREERREAAKEERKEIVPAETVKPAKVHKEPRYVFMKLPGLNAKCKNLLSYQDRILVSSAKGLYEVRNKQAYPVIRENYIYSITPSLDAKSLLIATRNGLLKAELVRNQWKIHPLSDETINASSVCEFSDGSVWAGSNGKLIRLIKDKEGKVVAKKSYILNNIHENIAIRNINGLLTFFASHDTYYYNSQQDTIERDFRWDSLSLQFTFSQNQPEYTWVRYDSAWIGIHYLDEQKNLRSSHLAIFKRLKDIYQDPAGSLWIIDGSNHIYKMEPEKQIVLSPFELHVKEIRNHKGNSLPLSNLQLAYDNNSLHFYLAAPFYMDEKSVHFQYFLEGINDKWSDWTNNHNIELAYLPIGDYILHIRARNGLGQISREHKVEFHILPPYWKTRWFFIAEILFFFSLIVVSVFLNRRKGSSFFTKALTFLTLIILVEFIVYEMETLFTVGNADSPLIRFGFNVLLALMISPIEKILELFLSSKKRRIAKILLLMRRRPQVNVNAEQNTRAPVP